MAAIVTEGDINYLRSLYPELDIKVPTGQQEQLLLHYFRGASIPAAAEAAGYRFAESARDYLRTDSARTILEYLREKEFNDIRVTRDSVTGMLFDAYHTAATAGEKVAAAREIAKLHGLYPEQRKAAMELHVHGHLHGDTPPTELNAKQLQKLPDDELMKLAGPEMLKLLTDAEVVEAEFEEMATEGEET